MRSGTLRPVALAGVALLAAGVALAGCGKADTGGGGSAASGELTLWTHNGGNTEDWRSSSRSSTTSTPARPSTRSSCSPSRRPSYNDAVTAAATAKKLPCILDIDGPNVPELGLGRLPGRRSTCPQDFFDKQLPSTLGKFDDKLYSFGHYDVALAIFARKSALDGRRHPDPDDRQAVDGGRVRRRRWRRSRPAASTRYALDLGTGDTGEWWTYALLAVPAELRRRPDRPRHLQERRGRAQRRRGHRWATWFQGLITKGYTPTEVRQGRRPSTSSTARPRSCGTAAGPANTDQEVRRRRGLPAAAGLRQRPEDRWRLVAVGDQLAAARPRRRAGVPEVLGSHPKYFVEFATKQLVDPGDRRRPPPCRPATRRAGPKRFFLDESQKYALIRPPTPGYPYITTTFPKAAQDIVAGGDARRSSTRRPRTSTATSSPTATTSSDPRRRRSARALAAPTAALTPGEPMSVTKPGRPERSPTAADPRGHDETRPSAAKR